MGDKVKSIVAMIISVVIGLVVWVVVRTLVIELIGGDSPIWRIVGAAVGGGLGAGAWSLSNKALLKMMNVQELEQ